MKYELPAPEEIPGVDSVRQEGIEDAAHILMHIRQVHDAEDMGDIGTTAVKIVHAEIERTLRFLIDDDRVRLKEVFAEGLSVDTNIPQLSDDIEQFAMNVADYIECLYGIDHISSRFLHKKLHSVYPNPEQRIQNERMDRRMLYRSAFWGDKKEFLHDEHDKEQWLYAMTKIAGEKRGNPALTVRDFMRGIVLSPMQEHLDEAWKLIEEDAVQLDELTTSQRYALRCYRLLCNQYKRYEKRRKKYKQSYKRAVRNRCTNGGSLYAEDKLFLEGAIDIMGCESPLFQHFSRQQPFCDDEDFLFEGRERSVIGVLHAMQRELMVTVFGGAHDFWPEIQGWNAINPQRKIGLFEITPAHYNEQVELLYPGL